MKIAFTAFMCACVSYLFMCVCEEGKRERERERERERDGVSKLSRVDVIVGSHSGSQV